MGWKSMTREEKDASLREMFATPIIDKYSQNRPIIDSYYFNSPKIDTPPSSWVDQLKNSFIDGGNTYTIQTGDNLSKIAKMYGITVKDLQRENNIPDEMLDKIFAGDILQIPHSVSKNTGPWHNYTIQTGDNLSTVSKNTGPWHNYTIQTGDNLSTVSKNTGPWHNFNALQKENEEINRTSNFNIINSHYIREGIETPYIVVDKKNKKLHICQNGEIVKSYNCALGKNGQILDDETYTYSDAKGKIINGAGNMSTPAGVFYAQSSKYQGKPSYMLQRQVDLGTDKGVASGIHVGDVKNNARSNGCVRLSEDDLYDIKTILGKDASIPTYILPVEEGNYFMLTNNSLQFHSNDKSTKLSDKKLIDGVTNLKGETIYQNATAPHYEHVEARQIKIDGPNVDDINTILKDMNILGKGGSGANERVIGSFIYGLQEYKNKLMEDLNISNTSYNQLSQAALGILGAETCFGNTNNLVANAAKGLRKVYHKAMGDSRNVSSVDYKMEYKLNRDNNTIGLTQIRWKDIQEAKTEGYKKIKKLYEKYGITQRDLVYNAEKAAIATMIFLGIEYNNQGGNSVDRAIKGWNRNTSYVNRVKKLSDLFTIYEKY